MTVQGSQPRSDHGVPNVRELERRIASRVGRGITDLKIIVQAQGLILRGRFPNYYSKQLAQQAALEVGAPVLANDIQVAYPPR